jgi:hypothetical protein
MNILNGGLHADNNLDLQGFMIVPAGAGSFVDMFAGWVGKYPVVSIEDGLTVPQRTRREIQPAPAHRGGDRGKGQILRDEDP